MLSELKEMLKGKGFDSIDSELEKTALIQKVFADRFPFENLDVLLSKENSITPDFLYEKMIGKKRGGLCYELNPLLYLVLKKLGYNVFLAAATVKTDSGWATDRTHVLILFWHGKKLYAIDSGFGSNLPLQPVELDGPEVQSPSGRYRLRSNHTEKGSIALETKRGNHWVVRYAFYPDQMEWEELDQIKRTIQSNPDSAFNKALLIARVSVDGTLTINEERLLIRHLNGDEQRIHFTSSSELADAVGNYFSQSVHQAAVRYISQMGSEKGRENE